MKYLLLEVNAINRFLSLGDKDQPSRNKIFLNLTNVKGFEPGGRQETFW
jgi:hypothetical protein